MADAASGIVVTEVAATGDAGVVHSLETQYDHLCLENMRAVLKLDTDVIVAFGDYTQDKWHRHVHTDLKEYVSTATAVIAHGVRGLQLTRLDGRLVHVWFCCHPCAWSRFSDLCRTLAVAHGLDVHRAIMSGQRMDGSRVDLKEVVWRSGPVDVVEITIDATRECDRRYALANGVLTHNCFESLPFMLLHNYSGFALGNERSADSAQVTHSALSDDREVNHQWLKSFEACSALRAFMQSTLVRGVEFFSILKPLHDYRIYQLLKRYPQVLPDIHSCNIEKPWCKKCPKCAYVFVNLVAIFGYEQVFAVFQENLWDVPALQQSWVELLGLGEHNAFECVGEVDETRLAFEKCARDGGKGLAIDLFKARFISKTDADRAAAAACSATSSPSTSTTPAPIVVDYESLRAKFNHVYDFDHGIPPFIFDVVQKNMNRD